MVLATYRKALFVPGQGMPQRAQRTQLSAAIPLVCRPAAVLEKNNGPVPFGHRSSTPFMRSNGPRAGLGILHGPCPQRPKVLRGVPAGEHTRTDPALRCSHTRPKPRATGLSRTSADHCPTAANGPFRSGRSAVVYNKEQHLCKHTEPLVHLASGMYSCTVFRTWPPLSTTPC